MVETVETVESVKVVMEASVALEADRGPRMDSAELVDPGEWAEPAQGAKEVMGVLVETASPAAERAVAPVQEEAWLNPMAMWEEPVESGSPKMANLEVTIRVRRGPVRVGPAVPSARLVPFVTMATRRRTPRLPTAGVAEWEGLEEASSDPVGTGRRVAIAVQV